MTQKESTLVNQRDLSGPNGSQWWIDVEDGTYKMGKEKIPNPSVTFIAKEKDWVAICHDQLSGRCGLCYSTLWEFGGKYISGDHPSGRLIKFPNEKVLDEIVYNYSWPLFPYIWNEIKFHVAYNANLEFIASTMQKITEEELGEEMMRRVETFRDLLARTPVDELEVRERPRVFFRPSENTWLEAIVRYLVAPREAGRVKNRLIKKLLGALNAAPEKVMFPAGAAR